MKTDLKKTVTVEVVITLTDAEASQLRRFLGGLTPEDVWRPMKAVYSTSVEEASKVYEMTYALYGQLNGYDL